MRFSLFISTLFITSRALADIRVTDLLNDDSRDTKMVMFQQAASSGTDATSVSKITLAYFTSADCTGSKAGAGSYTTPNGTTYTIAVGTAFGMVAGSAWKVGGTQLSIADMTTVQSIAVTFKSTNSSTPQAAFTNASAQVIGFACVPVTCTAGPSGECTSGSGTQSFTLKTTAAVGDPADGGIIGCLNTGIGANLYDLVVALPDVTSLPWGPNTTTTTNATSSTDGATNTATIVATYGSGSVYAARTCLELSATGGFTSGWFLPSGSTATSQTVCLSGNRVAIGTGAVAAGGSALNTSVSGVYLTSTEASANSAATVKMGDGSLVAISKTSTNRRVRCVRSF